MTDIQKENKSGGKVPNLRFPNFYSDWEVKKLGEISTNKSKKYNPNNETNFIKCIELEHLSSETGQLLGFVDGSQSGSIKNVFQKGNVLFGKLRPYLKKYYQPNFDGVCSSEIWVLNGKEILNDFLYYLIQTNSFVDLANQSSGSKMPRADWSILENGLFSFPNSEEQQKIASFLSLIDERIQTQNKIIEQLETLIKGLSEKLFSQNIRFKDFKGEWEVKKLGEVFYSEKGKGLSKDKLDSNGQYECVLYGELYTKYKEVIFNIVSKTNEEDGLKSKTGDLLIPSSTTTSGIDLANVTALNKENVLLGGDITVLRSEEKINNIFYAYYLSNYKKEEIASYAQGSTIVHLYYNHLKNMLIDLPSFEEQTKIANYLHSIDQKIQTEKAILEQLEMQKKYLLQQMFV